MQEGDVVHFPLQRLAPANLRLLQSETIRAKMSKAEVTVVGKVEFKG